QWYHYGCYSKGWASYRNCHKAAHPMSHHFSYLQIPGSRSYGIAHLLLLLYTRPLLRLYETPVYFADPVGSYRRPTRIRLYNLNGRRHPEQLEFYNNRGKNLSTSLAQIR